MIWLGWVLWHINHSMLFNAKSSLYILYIYIYIYILNIYIWFDLVGFYGISIIVGYLMSNPVYTYILNIFVNSFCRHTLLNDQTVLFLTIQFSTSHLFAFSVNVKQFYLTHRYDPIWC